MAIRAIFYGHTFSWTAINNNRPHLDNPLIRLDDGGKLKLVWDNDRLETTVTRLPEGGMKKEAPIIGFALSVISCMGLHYGLHQRAWTVAQTVLRIHESADKHMRPDPLVDYEYWDNYNSENYQLEPWSRLAGYGLLEQQVYCERQAF